MDISYDRFIRTTDDYHMESCQKIFTKLYEQGDIYKGEYTGHYCKPCESFWTDSQLVDGKCPECGREVYDATRKPTSSRPASTPTVCSSSTKRTPSSSSPRAARTR